MDDWLEAYYEDRNGTDADDGDDRWEAGSYGDTLICACGEELELDAAECSCGAKNPLVAQGLI